MARDEVLPFDPEAIRSGQLTVVGPNRAGMGAMGLVCFVVIAVGFWYFHKHSASAPFAHLPGSRGVLLVGGVVGVLAAARMVVAAARREPALVISRTGLTGVGILGRSRMVLCDLDGLRFEGEDGQLRIVRRRGDDLYLARYEMHWSDGRVERWPASAHDATGGP